MKRVLLLTSIGIVYCAVLVNAQNVFNPNDLNRRWKDSSAFNNDSTRLTADPNPTTWGLQKWVSVKSTGVDSTTWGKDYKAYYFNFNGAGLSFRLKYPYSYSNPDSVSKKYPMAVFFHGAGEPGCPANGGVYNNENQLVHGGKQFRDRVANNQFDGFLVYPQIVSGDLCWSDWGVAPYSINFPIVIAIIDSLVKYGRADIDRVFVYGLSNGGGAAWSMATVYPQRVTKAAPSSAASTASNFSDFVHVPIWFATGGKDTSPNPGYAFSTYTNIKNYGADIRYTKYDDLGHFVWTNHWSYPDAAPPNTPITDYPLNSGPYQSFVEYMNDMHKTNPLVYFQRYAYCPDSPINSRIGITGGYYAYEWQRNGITVATRVNGVNTIIDGSSIISYTGNEITVNAFGTYRVRIKRTVNSDWSIWSPKPAAIVPKTTTITPTIAINGLRSKVLPAPDGSTTVPLILPPGFFGYQWVRVSDNAIVSTSNTYTAPIGQYKAKIIEQFGCGTIFSPIFTVVDANGSPKPDAAKNLSALAASVSSIQLDWNENPNAGENETGFEIYRGTTAGGPYQYVGITAPNVVTYLDQNLQPNTKYYYIVRAVGNFGAAPNSNEANAETQVDNINPTAPGGLTVTCASRDRVGLKWNASTDNLGIAMYDIYVNGIKSYSTTQTRYTIYQLNALQTYTFTVKARDGVGNVSAASNQVTADTRLQGLCYKFYQGDWDVLPDYNYLIPTDENISANASISSRPSAVNDNFGFLWEGMINITTSGNYVFQTCSDAGSKLYFNMPFNHMATPTVNNDGLHGTSCVSSSTIALTPGVYPIGITYFEKTGAESMSLNWSIGGGAFAAIPNANFTEIFVPGGTAPLAPSGLTATAVSYNKINLSWTDNSLNETGFEVVRYTLNTGLVVPVATVTGNTYSDSVLSAGTTYFYAVRAIGAYGQSNYTGLEVNWKVNNSTADANGSGTRTLGMPGGTSNPVYNFADKAEGTYSLSFDGTNDYMLVNNSSAGGFPSDGAYSQRMVNLWVNPTAVNNKRMLFDFGGPDNGLGLRFNLSNLEARVVSNNTGVTVSLAGFAGNANWVSGYWNLISVIYNQNSLKLFLNGVEVAANNSLPFSSVAGISTSTSQLGYPGATNVWNDAPATYSYYAGLMDDIYIFGKGAVTQNAPAPPNAPSNLTAQVVSKENVNLTWDDNSSNETGFEVWRSVANNTNYRLVKLLPSGSTPQRTYSDTALFANITYYYKVRALGQVNPSAYTPEVSATTQNTAPVLTNILDFTMKYGTTYSLPVNAIDEDGDALTFTFDNLPVFATIQPVSNGNININYHPNIGDQGAYTITVFVSDGHNGRDTTYFTMVVNDNAIPALNPLSNVVMNEGSTVTVPLLANDAEGNNYMVWSFAGKPSFATFTDSGNGHASLKLRPGYAASGIYTTTVYVDDGNGGWTSRTFTITVNESNPNETIQVNFKYFTGNVPLWNDVDLFSLPKPFTVSNLKNTRGDTTTVGLNAIGSNYDGSAQGVQTGNNSGIYPDAVMKDFLAWGLYNFGNTDTLQLRISGLNTTKRYNLIFFGSSTINCCGVDGNSVTTYRVGNDFAEVRYYLNSTQTDTIYQAVPNGSGEIFVTMIGNAATLAGGVLNAMVIDAQFDDGTTPVKPLNLTGEFIQNTGVRLNWIDRAYNELSYKVYRANVRTGPYALLNAGQTNKDSVSYTDGTTAPYSTYYYYVAGSNNWGIGAASDTISVTTGNNSPLINNLSNIYVKTDASVQEDFSVSDNIGDIVTVSVENAPSFATLTNLSGGNYRITVSPTVDNIGWFNLIIKAKDDKGATSTQKVTITVADKNTRSVFVNFGDFGKTAPLPWNNFLHYGNAGSIINNLVDENNVNTGFSMQLVNAWTSMFNTGHITGNDSGVYPDSVLQSGIYYDNTTARQITISGLDNAKRYNIVLLGSQNEGYDASARYTVNVGSQSDTLNGRNNTNCTANLNGLTPSSGAITVSITKLTSALRMYLNAIVIEEYSPAITLLNPINLYVEPKDRTTTVLSWSDRTNNENLADGYQLQRATDSLFTVNLATITLGSNNSMYTNTGLGPDTKYWYRVRAKSGASTFSEWSNRVKTITPLARVSVNFNFSVTDAAAPWNNLDYNPTSLTSFFSLKDQANNNSGLSLSITAPFNGENNAGMNTGNNSGVVPDNVLRSSYWIDNEQHSQMKLSGLNQSKRYRVGFIASSNWIGGDLTTTMTISGRTVYINSWQNTTKIVSIGNIAPDANGEIYITFSTTAPAANGYSSGILVDVYDDTSGGSVINAPNLGGPDKYIVQETDKRSPVSEQEESSNLRIYPNPFTDFVNMDFQNKSVNNNVSVEVFDITGRLVQKYNYNKLPEGYNSIHLSMEGKLESGIYMIALKINGKVAKTGKLIKSK